MDDSIKTPGSSLLSFDQVVKFDTDSIIKLVVVLVLASILVGLTLRLAMRKG